MATSALHDALLATVDHCEAMAEAGQTETLQGALLFMVGHLEGDDPAAAELIEDLMEATQ